VEIERASEHAAWPNASRRSILLLLIVAGRCARELPRSRRDRARWSRRQQGGARPRRRANIGTQNRRAEEGLTELQADFRSASTESRSRWGARRGDARRRCPRRGGGTVERAGPCGRVRTAREFRSSASRCDRSVGSAMSYQWRCRGPAAARFVSDHQCSGRDVK